MLEPLFKRGVEAIQLAKKEPEFWLEFETLSKEMSSYPNGLLVLGTPSVRMAALRTSNAPWDTVLEECIEKIERNGTSLWLARDLTIEKLGQIRREVRAGNYVLSARDTNRQWTMVADLRGKGRVFTDPMAPDDLLGLARAQGHPARSVVGFQRGKQASADQDWGDDRKRPFQAVETRTQLAASAQ